METVLHKALLGGVDLVQFRDKVSSRDEMIRQSMKLLKITRRYRVALIINDRLDVALAAEADGLHLGQDDIPIRYARRLLKKDALLGLSCHSMQQIKEAQSLDVDYVGFGPVFATPTKAGVKGRGVTALRAALRLSQKPVYAIGGLGPATLPDLKNTKRLNIAVVRAICQAQDPTRAARQLKMTLDDLVS